MNNYWRSIDALDLFVQLDIFTEATTKIEVEMFHLADTHVDRLYLFFCSEEGHVSGFELIFIIASIVGI